MEHQASELNNGSERPGHAIRIPTRLRCIAVASGKGGVGKTMVSVGLGCAVSKLGYRALILDADLGLANVDLQMGLEPSFTMQDVIFGNCALEEAVLTTDHGPDVLAAASGAQELVEMGDARRHVFVDELIQFAGQYDYLIIDSAAGIGRGVTTFLAAAPEVLVVVANEPTSIMDAYSLIKVLRQTSSGTSVMMVINMVRTLEEGHTLAERLNAITRKFLGVSIPLGGIITRSDVVPDSIRAREPVLSYASESAPAKCLLELANSLSARDTHRRPKAGLLKNLFGNLANIGKPGR